MCLCVIAELHPGHYGCFHCSLWGQRRRQSNVAALQHTDHSHSHRHLWCRLDKYNVASDINGSFCWVWILFSHCTCLLCPSKGFDTIIAGLQWSLLYLIKFPEIQDRIHQEIGIVLCLNPLICLIFCHPCCIWCAIFFFLLSFLN